MTTLTITAKGQVTLKQELLKHLGVSPGEKIEADKLPDGRIVVRAAAPEARIADFIGCLSQKGGPKLTIDEMSEIATRGWARSEPLCKTMRIKPGRRRISCSRPSWLPCLFRSFVSLCGCCIEAIRNLFLISPTRFVA